MASLAVLPAMNGEKTIHAFFTKSNGHNALHGPVSESEPRIAHIEAQLDGAHDTTVESKENDSIRKSKPKRQGDEKKQKTLQEIVNPKPLSSEPGSAHDSEDSSALNNPRRKRRRISVTESASVGDVTEVAAWETPVKQSSPEVVIMASSPLPSRNVDSESRQERTPPKKMLRLNASGKFSSPASRKQQDVADDEDSPPVAGPKRRGRPRKSKIPKSPTSLIVKLSYAAASDTGSRITRILSGEDRFVPTGAAPATLRARMSRKVGPSKRTHPFFSGNAKPTQPAPKQESPRKASAVTPGKLRRQAISERLQPPAAASAGEEYVVGSGLFKDRLMFKHPGAREPAWPTKDQVHVRGVTADELYNAENHKSGDESVSFARSSSVRDTPGWRRLGSRKRKTPDVPFPADESILNRFGELLELEQEGRLRQDGFREPHPSLSLPTKLLISGEEIARRTAGKLSVAMSHNVQNVSPHASKALGHAALQKLFSSIPTTLSAFDEQRGEPANWAQKYEPSTALEVLQPAREMQVLKDWLSSLTISAVSNTVNVESKIQLKPELKVKKKRRRKNSELDDFLVDSDEEVHDMNELSDPENNTPQPGDRKNVKSVVQVGTEGGKFSNAVLLSGPHGCGKTAAAHAVAKELGFKIFEISPCERRSGKDIMEKVGDMTENHLVKHHGTESAGEISSTEEPSRNEEAFQRDLASGRQGKMSAFFMPKPTKSSLKKKRPPPQSQASVITAVQNAVKKASKHQQQSLILLEEVDVLFPSDKDFWSTVFRLIATSKRPFIMTCNDEDLVPLQSMSLHAILRFSPPPVDLVADYLLLIAAAEGHLIERDAATCLYEAKGHDFRSSIAELNFWCQMGVGDPRSGLSWIFQRYPPGSDLNAYGRQVRVVSEGTYHVGIGLTSDSPTDDESQMLRAWQEFGLEPATILAWNDAEAQHPLSLKSFAQFSHSLSDTDVFCSTSNALDTNQPPMSDGARTHYIEGMQLLQTDDAVSYSTMMQQLSISSTLLTYRTAGMAPPRDFLPTPILSKYQQFEPPVLTRGDFICFDLISIPLDTTISSAGTLIQSSFDGPLEPIAIDIAPYVRSILQHERMLAEYTKGMYGDPRSSKRPRSTRAARSALGGSQRASTRREKWFTKDLNTEAVLATGGESWPKMGLASLGLDLPEIADGGSRDESETSPAPSAGS